LPNEINLQSNFNYTQRTQLWTRLCEFWNVNMMMQRNRNIMI